MQLPRMTTRRWMVAVAAVALMLWVASLRPPDLRPQSLFRFETYPP